MGALGVRTEAASSAPPTGRCRRTLATAGRVLLCIAPMSDDDQTPPESLLPYEAWTQDALRQVVARAVAHAGLHGMPGQHHFYITFRTDHPGVVIPPRLRAQYPQEMTIVLQHQFWDLKLDEAAGLFSVGLSFGGAPASLVIPLQAVTGFADPAVRFGLAFQPVMPEGTVDVAEASPEAAEPQEEPASENQPETPQVVSLDAFRRRPPSKT
jgi:hypothetical protein